jgi:hypothetical protein
MPSIHWAPGQPALSLLATYSSTARHLSRPEILELFAKPCSCHLPRFRQLCPPGLHHVVTTDPPSHLLPPALRDLWDGGAHYRPHLPPAQPLERARSSDAAARGARPARRVPSAASTSPPPPLAVPAPSHHLLLPSPPPPLLPARAHPLTTTSYTPHPRPARLLAQRSSLSSCVRLAHLPRMDPSLARSDLLPHRLRLRASQVSELPCISAA